MNVKLRTLLMNQLFMEEPTFGLFSAPGVEPAGGEVVRVPASLCKATCPEGCLWPVTPRRAPRAKGDLTVLWLR